MVIQAYRGQKKCIYINSESSQLVKHELSMNGFTPYLINSILNYQISTTIALLKKKKKKCFLETILPSKLCNYKFHNIELILILLKKPHLSTNRARYEYFQITEIVQNYSLIKRIRKIFTYTAPAKEMWRHTFFFLGKNTKK